MTVGKWSLAARQSFRVAQLEGETRKNRMVWEGMERDGKDGKGQTDGKVGRMGPGYIE